MDELTGGGEGDKVARGGLQPDRYSRDVISTVAISLVKTEFCCTAAQSVCSGSEPEEAEEGALLLEDAASI